MNKYMGADPDARYFPNGQLLVNLSVGVSKKWKDKETGETKEKTEWPRFVAVGKQAEVIRDYLKKGSEVLITDSELRGRSYENKDGQTVYVTEFFIKPGGFEFCGKKSIEKQTDHLPMPQGQETELPEDDVPF